MLANGIISAVAKIGFKLGMNSAVAATIVNALNARLQLDLPLNTCHIHIDLLDLTAAVFRELGLDHAAAARSERWTQSSSSSSPSDSGIVIVGQAVRLPGGLNSPESLWKALVEKRDDLMTPVPSDRWDHASFYRPPSSSPHEPGDIIFEKAGFIDFASFDNSFFGISAPEAINISPAVRLTLEVAFDALENANIPVSRVKSSNMGVFVATGMDLGYDHLLFSDRGYAGECRPQLPVLC